MTEPITAVLAAIVDARRTRTVETGPARRAVDAFEAAARRAVDAFEAAARVAEVNARFRKPRQAEEFRAGAGRAVAFAVELRSVLAYLERTGDATGARAVLNTELMAAGRRVPQFAARREEAA